VRTFLVLTALAAAGFALAACGSGAKRTAGPGALTFTGSITTTIADVQTGDDVRCRAGTGASVPAPGHGVSAIGDGTSLASSADLELTRRSDGSLVVICRP
jgi:hypothetical protein